MADQLQLRRGTTAENLAFTGAQGEVTIDTDKNAIVIHDGVTAGGYPQASEAALNNFTTFFDDDVAGGSTADAYLLSAKDDSLLPNEYNDGQVLGFVTTNTNTGPSTANFIGLGQKNIKYADGTDPEPGDINGRVTMIYDATNNWLELQRKFQAAQVQTKASVRQTVYTGPVDANGRADFIDAGTGLQAVTSGLASNALILAFGKGFDAFGASDVVVSVGSNQTFGGLADNDVNYLYLEYDEDAETITPGSTILAPVYSQAKPTAPATGQYWYPIDHRSSGEVWGGSAWQPTLRVFVGQAETSAGSVVDAVSYAYQGRSTIYPNASPSAGLNVYAHNIGCVNDLKRFIGKVISTADGYSVDDNISLNNAEQYSTGSSNAWGRGFIYGENSFSFVRGSFTSLATADKSDGSASALLWSNINITEITIERAF